MMTEIISHKSDSSNKKYTIIVLVVQFCFMMSYFGSLNWYIPNREEFWFSIWQLLLVDSIIFIISFAVLNSIGNIIKLNKKLALIVYDAFLVVNLCLYIQGNFIPRNYGILNGGEIDWTSYTGYAIASIIVVVVCVLVGIALFFILKEKIFKIGKYIAIFVLLIQIVTITTMIIQNINSINKVDNRVVTKEDIFDFSKEDNVVIFILDAFDSSYMMEALNGEKGTKCNQVLKDFSYYPDAVGAYSSTRGSIPFIFTGVWNDNSQKFDDFIVEAYRETELYDELLAKGYKINLYPEYAETVSPEVDFISNIHEGQYSIKSLSGLIGTTMKMTMFNYSPHQCKRFFYVGMSEFSKWKKSKNGALFQWDILDFYNYFAKNGISTDSEQPTFKAYHVSGTHPEYTFDENLKMDSNKEYGPMDEAYGSIEILRQMFDAMKEAGIYENSTIIVMADHGFDGSSADFNANPLFMIKNKNECHSNVNISEAPMSWEYLQSILISLSRGEIVDEKYIMGFEGEERKFYYYNWEKTGFAKDYLPTITKYICIDDASDRKNYYMTGDIFMDENKMRDFSYHLGDVIDFKTIDNSEAATKYILHGVTKSEGYGSWTYDTFANLRFDVDSVEEDLCIAMDIVGIKDETQEVQIRANEEDIVSYNVKQGEIIKAIIPKELIKNNTIDLSLVLPNATAGTNGDLRKLGICLGSVSIKEVSKDDYYHLGNTVTFGKNGNYGTYMENGFVGDDHWTVTNEGIFSFLVDENTDMRLDMTFGVFGEEQQVLVYANDKLLSEFVATGDEAKSIYIPKEYIENNILELKFALPEAKEPGNGDNRKLGLYMSSMQINKEEVSEYQLGTEISFGIEANINNYCNDNSFSEDQWTIDNKASVRLITDEKDLALTLNYSTFDDSLQRVKLKANGREIADYIACGTEIKTFYIPQEYLIQGYLEIMMELPDAKSGNGDSRKLALCMHSMTIDEAEVGEYELGTELTFGSDGTIYIYCDEDTFSDDYWTVSDKAVMRFLTKGENLQLTMDFATLGSSQEVIIKANGQEIADFVAQGEMTQTIDIPNECRFNDYLEIEMDFPDARVPGNGDMRKLALKMHSLSIDEE